MSCSRQCMLQLMLLVSLIEVEREGSEFWFRTIKGRNHLEDLGISGRVMLHWV